MTLSGGFAGKYIGSISAKNNFVYLSGVATFVVTTGDLPYSRGIHFHSKWQHASAHDARFRGIFSPPARGAALIFRHYARMLIHGDAYRLNDAYTVCDRH